LPEIVKTQVEAVKDIKIDKVTVWDSGKGGDDGNTSTANFVSGLMKTIPPLDDLFDLAGMNLPSYLKGKDKASPNIPMKPDENGSNDIEVIEPEK